VLGSQIEENEEKPGDVPARPGEASDVAQCHWVGIDAHQDDRNCPRRFLRRISRGSGRNDDDVDAKTDQLGRERRKLLEVPSAFRYSKAMFRPST
jgi:hypothetical protein